MMKLNWLSLCCFFSKIKNKQTWILLKESKNNWVVQTLWDIVHLERIVYHFELRIMDVNTKVRGINTGSRSCSSYETPVSCSSCCAQYSAFSIQGTSSTQRSCWFFLLSPLVSVVADQFYVSEEFSEVISRTDDIFMWETEKLIFCRQEGSKNKLPRFVLCVLNC